MTDRVRWVGVAACLVLGACGGDRSGPVRQDSTLTRQAVAPVELLLAAPESVGWNQPDSVRVTVVNHTTTALDSPRVSLTLAAPAVFDDTTAHAADGWTTLEVVLPPAPAGGTATAVRLLRPPPAPLAPDTAPRSYPVRATLASHRLTREDTLHVRPGSAAVAGGCATPGSALAQRYGVGPVRVRMRASALRAACPEARDSAWSSEGDPQHGLVVRVGGVPLLAELRGDTIWRIQVADPRLRTAAGMGVGATLADLRARYGAACAGAGEGIVAVWFQNAPGISFALDSITTRSWLAGSHTPAELPDSARVDRYLVHGLDPRCPTR